MTVEESVTMIEETKKLIDLELSKFVMNLKPRLIPQVEYALLSGGKRLRPLMVLLACQSVGGNWEEAVPLALSFELAHSSSLIHDDIIDSEALRRGKPAFHNRWSANSAIVTGDLLIGYAVYLASGYGSEVMKSISQSSIDLCEGEQMDLDLSLDSPEEGYFRMIELKSASLFQAAAGCGATVGGASSDQLKSLQSFGKNFGVMYQLVDDLADLAPHEGKTPEDIRMGRITLPIIHICKMSPPDERRTILKALSKAAKKRHDESLAAARNIYAMLEESGSIDYLLDKIVEYRQLTIASLASVRDSPYKQALLQMSKLLERSL